jgi:archaellum component FlaC
MKGLKSQIKEAQSSLSGLEKQYKQKEKEVVDKRVTPIARYH